MKSHGPKALIKVKGDTTILENQIKYIQKYLHRPEIIIVAGFEAHKVYNAVGKRRNVKVVENLEWENTNVVSSLGIGLQEARHKNILIVYGDLIFNAWTLKVPMGSYSMILMDKYGLMKDEEVGCVIHNNRVEQIMYSLPEKWAQIAYFVNQEAELLKTICADPKYKGYFGFEVINMIINEGGAFAANANPRSRITDIDSSRDLSKIEEIL